MNRTFIVTFVTLFAAACQKAPARPAVRDNPEFMALAASVDNMQARADVIRQRNDALANQLLGKTQIDDEQNTRVNVTGAELTKLNRTARDLKVAIEAIGPLPSSAMTGDQDWKTVAAADVKLKELAQVMAARYAEVESHIGNVEKQLLASRRNMEIMVRQMPWWMP